MQGPLDLPVYILNLVPIEKHLTALAFCFASGNLWTDREAPLIGTEVFPVIEFFSEHMLVVRVSCCDVLVQIASAEHEIAPTSMCWETHVPFP